MADTVENTVKLAETPQIKDDSQNVRIGSPSRGPEPLDSDVKFDQLTGNVHFYEKQPASQFAPLRSLFSKEVKLSTVLQEVKRDEVAYRALKKLSGDIFDKWFEVRATYESNGNPNEKLNREIEAINDRLDVKENFKHAWELKMMLGFSLIALGWNDS